MPIWSYFLIWLLCGFAIALLVGRAMRAVDEDYPPVEAEHERTKQIDTHAMRSHAILVGDLRMPERRGSR